MTPTGTFASTAVGDIVTLVSEVEGEVKKVPAMVVKLYEDAHSKVVADLHRLEANVLSVAGREDATDEDTGVTGQHVVTYTTPAPAPPVTPAVTDASTTAVTDPIITAAESAYNSMTPEERAAFAAFQAAQGAPAASADPPATSSTGATTTG